MEQQLTKNTVFNFFSGQSTPLEKQLIEEWLKNRDNKEVYYQWLEEYEQSHPQIITETEAALNKFLLKAESTEEHSTDILPGRKSYRWLWFAASLVIIVISWMVKDSIISKTYSAGFSEVKIIKLEDGSTVTLNSNSSIRVSRFAFGDDHREVFLMGEAEFKVVHTKDNTPFFVKTPDQLQVEVLGTEFIVYSRDRGSKVILNKGSVRIKSLENKEKPSLQIKPGDVVTINTKGEFQLKKEQSLEKYIAWKDKRFVFDHTSLNEISRLIEENFGVEVKIPDSALSQRQLTGTYKVDNQDDLINVLVVSMNLKISKKGNQIILTK